MMRMNRWMAAVMAMTLATLVCAQDQGQGWSVVIPNNARVYSGRGSDSYYHFYELRSGELVWVVGVKDGWAQVRPTGPAFGEAFGYVKVDDRVELAADGKKGRIIAKTDLLAPHKSNKASVDSSWKPLARLEPGEEITIYGKVDDNAGSAYKVALPQKAEAYVSLAVLRPASTEEVGAYESRIAKSSSEKVDTPPATPTSPTIKTPDAPPSSDAAPKENTSAAKEGETSAPPVSNAETPPATAPAIVPVDKKASGGPPSTDAPAADAPKVKKVEEVTLSDLEGALKALDRQPRREQEVGPLHERYLEFADRPTISKAEREFAQARAADLEVRAEVQKRLASLEELRAMNNRERDNVEAAMLRIQARADYVVVGRLNASTIYDGQRLPLLYRVQDDGTGQTIAYMRPGSTFDLTGMLGQLIGIVGEKSYDAALRVNIVAPDRIDVLGPRDATKEPPAN